MNKLRLHAYTVVVLSLLLVAGCSSAGGIFKPTKPAVVSAAENVKDADDHLAAAENELRKNPPAVTNAQDDIGSARNQLAYAANDLKGIAKQTSVNDAKAREYDDLQRKWYVVIGKFVEGLIWLGVILTLVLGIGGGVARVAGPGWWSLPLYWVSHAFKFIVTAGIPYFVRLWQWFRGPKAVEGGK